jgi:hypothetical protein
LRFNTEEEKSMPTTLAIDYGSKNIGLALVRNNDSGNEPLFAGTLKYNNFTLKKKVQPRADIRRTRRTRKTKKTRLRLLHQNLLSIGISVDKVPDIVRFCRRRGYKSLWDDDKQIQTETKSDADEILYRFSRETFFQALDLELQRLLPQNQYPKALKICEKILNRKGDRFQEIRTIRIDNRGVSRCAWDGCDKVTPRRQNAVRDALSQAVYTIYQAPICKNPDLRNQIENMLDYVAVLAKRYRNASGSNPTKERRALMKTIRSEFKLLQQLTEEDLRISASGRDAKEVWKYNKKNFENIVTRQTGRNRYCRNHSSEYVDYVLNSKPIPFKKTLTEKDIFSRREEILFGKLWRYIEARLLPLTPDGIDRVVVERTAFDLLAGTRKQRDKLSDAKLEDMYQHGPRFGFDDDLEMLRAEFDGRCAYCGKQDGNLIDRDHILPRASFFFDSYINIVPACPTCNSNLKGKLTPGASALRINDDAYEAYSKHLNKQKPPHLFQTIKKGILNLMRQPDRVWEAEAYLALIADQFAAIVQAQRGPRPLARFISEKLRKHQKWVPRVSFCSGRHTEVWRRAAYAEYDKAADKSEGNVVNHALDAILLGCRFPSVSALESKHLRSKDINAWRQEVQMLAPKPGPQGIPELPLMIDAVPAFENIEPGNFISADLALFNWNRKNCGTHKQDPFSWNRNNDCPSKRVKASELVADLMKEKKESKVQKTISQIVHPNLKNYLQDCANGDNAGEKIAKALIEWLRKTMRNSLPNSEFSNHPGDRARKNDLNKFSKNNDSAIPAVIGIKMLFPEQKGNVDLNRQDCKTGAICHRYMTNPSNVCLILAYPKNKKSLPERKKPLILEVRQSGAVQIKSGKRNFQPIPEGPLNGRILGDKNNQFCTLNNENWDNCLKEYLSDCEIAEYAFISQGCVVQYKDGSQHFVRNFSRDYGFKISLLKGVTGVRKSPLRQAVQPMIRLNT